MQINFADKIVDIPLEAIDGLEDLANSKDRFALLEFLLLRGDEFSKDMREAIKKEEYGIVQRCEGAIQVIESLNFLLSEGFAEALKQNRRDNKKGE